MQHARGKYLVRINDNTISASDLLARHWNVHQNRGDIRQCVLGDFRFPPAAQERALTRFLTQSPFFFPQLTLRAGEYREYAYVVTCNSSVKRDALLAVGSFDARVRVAEDSDLGVPDVSWDYHFSGMVRTWDAASVHPSTESLRAAIVRDEA